MASQINIGDAWKEIVTGVIEEANGTNLKPKVIDIGTWDMDASTQKSVAHGLSDITAIRSVDVIILKDDASEIHTVAGNAAADNNGYISSIDATNVVLRRLIGGGFDNTDFDDIDAADDNRGWITIWCMI